MPAIQEKTTCHHCGEHCKEDTIIFEQHSFCCHGCRSVYQLLHDTGLTNYYDIEKAPGATMRSENAAPLDFLDLEEVKQTFIDFTEGSSNKVTFYLPTIHCAACIWLLEKLDHIQKGITRSEVNFLRKELTVFFDADILSLKELVQFLEGLGYPPDLQRNKEHSKKNVHSKELLLKLGVAGFCFGNIMLFSFPEYLSLDEESLDGFKGLFSYLNFMLALPVLFYADVEYLRSAWQSIKLRYLTIDVPISLGILTLFGRSAFEVISGTGPGYFDSFAGLIFFLLIGKWYQSLTYESLAFDRDFRSYFPMAVARLKEDGEEVVMLENVRPGDRLRILSKQVIPADCVLKTGDALIDYSFVNGESNQVQKAAGDALFAGGRQMSGAIEVEVIKEVAQGYLTSLWNQRSAEKATTERPFSGLIDKISKYFSAAILLIAFATLIYWLIADASKAFDAFSAVLIIACPCALALSMPFASGSVSRILGKWGVFVKNASTLERMASINTIVFDKTGTLTQGTNQSVEYTGQVLTAQDQALAKNLARQSTHPLSVSIAQELDGHLLEVSEFHEATGIGICGSINGQWVAMGSRMLASELKMESAALNADQNSGIHSEVHLWIESEYKGCFKVRKSLRTGIEGLLKRLQGAAKLHLVSGDNDSEKAKMSALFGATSEVHFEQSPIDKLAYIEVLQTRGEQVMMLGDGLNDAGALKQANVGVAVADDVFSFSPACDVILQADRLQRLDAVMRYVRQSMWVVRLSVIISLSYNVVGLYFAVQSELTPLIAAVLMPLSSVSAIFFVTAATYWLRPKA